MDGQISGPSANRKIINAPIGAFILVMMVEIDDIGYYGTHSAVQVPLIDAVHEPVSSFM